jgi:tripartite-type tricarboxylate transporter receptor subunit TctC
MMRIFQAGWAAAVLAAAVLFEPGSAFAQYPTRPVRIMVPNEAGGVYDLVGRLLAGELSKRLGQSVFVENRPGGGSVTGTLAAATAAPDGYTLLMGGLSNIAFNPGLYEKLPYNPIRDFVPIGLAYTFPYVMVARAGLPQSSVAEIVAAARQNPDSLSIGSPGRGSAPQVLGAAMMKSAGVRFVEIPYKGTQAQYTDLLAGRIDLMFSSESAALPHIATGKIKGIATAGPRRSSRAPDLPTMTEASMPGLEMEAWLGLFAPAATPSEILEHLRTELRESIPALKERFVASGGEPMQFNREETDAFVAKELARWTTVIREAGIRAD